MEQNELYHLSAVSELCSDGKLLTEYPHKVPILYRWWFPKNSKVVAVLFDYVQSHKEDVVMKQMLSRIIPERFGNTEYYCLYLGKGINGRRRFKNHISPRKRTSTLRRTISALLQTDDEKAISDVLMQCYYEWKELSCDNGELENQEVAAIADGNYPLNLKENEKISSTWKAFLQDHRKTMQ